ncbi:MAG: alanine racemase [Nitrospiria bacterium]
MNNRPNPITGGSYAEIHLGALEQNLLHVRTQVGNCPILAVVKANAYGHGAVRVARFLEQCRTKTDFFGVAFLEEGVALREAGIRTPILVLTGCPSDHIADLIRYNLTSVVFDTDTLSALNQAAAKRGRAVNVHLKIDTGMGRLGVLPGDFFPFFEKALGHDMISVEGILTHFAEADLNDLSFAKTQLNTIKTILSRLSEKGMPLPLCHMANSAAILHFKPAALSLVRPGLMLYGYSPLKEKIETPLTPLMQIKTRVIALKKVPQGTPISYGRTFVTARESRIATVAIGYADGYPLSLSNRGMMIAKGKRAPVAGRVCMDMCMLDVTEIPNLEIGDWVTVLGEEGDESIWADELAQWANTHPYELLCGIGPRVQRRYTLPSPSKPTAGGPWI